MSIRGTRLASGPITGTPVGGWYRYGGDQPQPPARSGTPDGGPGSSGRKQRRVEGFAEALRDQGYDAWTAPKPAVIEAGRRVGVGEDTARGYRNELKRRSLQDGEVRDG